MLNKNKDTITLPYRHREHGGLVHVINWGSYKVEYFKDGERCYASIDDFYFEYEEANKPEYK